VCFQFTAIQFSIKMYLCVSNLLQYSLVSFQFTAIQFSIKMYLWVSNLLRYNLVSKGICEFPIYCNTIWWVSNLLQYNLVSKCTATRYSCFAIFLPPLNECLVIIDNNYSDIKQYGYKLKSIYTWIYASICYC